PLRAVSTTRAATRFSLPTSATELPPYFWTTIDIRRSKAWPGLLIPPRDAMLFPCVRSSLPWSSARPVPARRRPPPMSSPACRRRAAPPPPPAQSHVTGRGGWGTAPPPHPRPPAPRAGRRAPPQGAHHRLPRQDRARPRFARRPVPPLPRAHLALARRGAR